MAWLEAAVLIALLALLTASAILDTQGNDNNKLRRRLAWASGALIVVAGIAMLRRLLDLR